MNGPESIDALRLSRRILVLGPSGSGKTYLSCHLGQQLDLPVIHLDALFWRPGWISTPQPVWREHVESLIRAERWIMDGTYESTLALRLPAADAVIVINRSRWLCLWDVARRTFACRNKARPDAPPGQPLDRPFLRYIWHYRDKTGPQVDALIDRYFSDRCAMVLSGTRDVKQLITALCMPREGND
jgi:adenylate kinase family enzyme